MAEETMGVGLGDALQLATMGNDGNGWGGGALWVIVLLLIMFGNGWNRGTSG